MKKTAKRLHLSGQTLRRLGAVELHGVAAGVARSIIRACPATEDCYNSCGSCTGIDCNLE